MKQTVANVNTGAEANAGTEPDASTEANASANGEADATSRADATARVGATPAADALTFECDLPEPRDKVWRALTERELLAAWLMPNDIRPQVGAKFQLRPGLAPVECEVLESEPGRLLRWRQREPAEAESPRFFIDSVVSFELADSPRGGTHLRVVHDGFTSVERCSTVVALRPRAQTGITPKLALTPKATLTKPAITMPALIPVSCSLRRAA